jgi:hypothetical protein
LAGHPFAYRAAKRATALKKCVFRVKAGTDFI